MIFFEQLGKSPFNFLAITTHRDTTSHLGYTHPATACLLKDASRKWSVGHAIGRCYTVLHFDADYDASGNRANTEVF